MLARLDTPCSPLLLLLFSYKNLLRVRGWATLLPNLRYQGWVGGEPKPELVIMLLNRWSVGGSWMLPGTTCSLLFLSQLPILHKALALTSDTVLTTVPSEALLRDS